MNFEGVLLKMYTELDYPIQYFLQLGEDRIHMNDVLDAQISMDFIHYQCLSCGKKKKIFRQGYCYDCFYKQPEVGDWIIRPELSRAHLGIEDRNLDYEKEVQLKPHIVYLALSSNVKVGVTRKTQVQTRWIDQGASKALEIVETPNRYLAGITEVALKDYLADKTNWRKMLKNEVQDEDLKAVKDAIIEYIPEEARPYITGPDAEVLELEYPVLQYPNKLKSLNLSKTPDYTGKLKGIKGQYLIFEDQTVFNVRNNEGHYISMEID